MKADHRSIIKAHISTERTSQLREQNNEYVFEVDKSANKHLIREAVETAFKVDVETVRTHIMPGKRKRLRQNTYGKTPSWKKAIVRVKTGQVIAQFENI